MGDQYPEEVRRVLRKAAGFVDDAERLLLETDYRHSQGEIDDDATVAVSVAVAQRALAVTQSMNDLVDKLLASDGYWRTVALVQSNRNWKNFLLGAFTGLLAGKLL